jgi:hypothetical protein
MEIENEKSRDYKKERKKRKKKEEKANLHIIIAVLKMLEKIVADNKNTNDMNLRCYLMIYNIALVLKTVPMSLTLSGGFPKESYETITKRLEPIQSELNDIMNWVIGGRVIPEFADPLTDQTI